MRKTVLVIDDDMGARTLMSIMLERGGFTVQKAKSAQDALDMLDSDPDDRPDMLILDVMMPGMSGIELCEVLRQREDTRHKPILILSALNDPDSIMAGMQAGADDYLCKPILHHDLTKKVRSMLGLGVS